MKTRLSGPVLIAFVLVLLYSMVPLVGSKGAAKTTGSFAASAATNSGKNITNVAQAGGTNAGTVKKAAQAGSQQTAKGACFTEGTQIVVGMEFTEDGVFVQYITVNIEDVRVGDWVYSYNTLTGETELAQVTATYSLRSDHINYLTIIDEDGNEQVIETTDAHPFWVVTDEPDRERAARSIVDENGVWLYHENIGPTENGFWVEAKDLRIGDVFLSANGKLSTLTNIVRVEQGGGIAVFNFSVEGNHNYFILAKQYGLGQTSVLVHNTCLEAMSKSASVMDRNGLTVAGRSLQKHAPRGGPYPNVGSNPARLNQKAQELVDDILTNPLSIVRQKVSKAFGQITEIRIPGSIGARFDKHGKFLHFLEP